MSPLEQLTQLPIEPSPRGGASPKARLALIDGLLAEQDGRGCAALALRWLERHCGIERSLCAVVDTEGTHLVGLAGVGIPLVEIDSFRLDLGERAHPLVLALLGAAPVAFHQSVQILQRGLPTPLGSVPFHALPLSQPVDPGELSPGMLLISGTEDGPVADEVRWVAELLGTRLLSLWYRRAQADERRHKRERGWLLSVINAVTDPILLTDENGRILIANSGAETLLSTEEKMSEGRRRAVALNNMFLSASLSTSGQDRAPTPHELVLVDPAEGQDLLFELLSTPVKLRRGETGTVSVLRNVTDLRRASQELEDNYRRLRAAEAQTRAERDRLDLILNSAIDPILVTDAAGAIVHMNPPAERMFTVLQPGGEEERRVRSNDAVFTSFVSNLYTGQSLRWRGELSLVDPQSGDTVPVEAFSGKVLSRQGEETWTVTILHDLTEAMEKAKLYEQIQRHSEELRARVREATAELAEQNELLRRQAYEVERASAAKSQFLANVSHELRTPLNAVVGYTYLLLEGVAGELGKSQRDKLVRIDANAKHLLSVINDLLDIARIEAGKLPVHHEPMAVEELLEEVMTEVEPLIARTNLAVTREVVAGVPELVADRKKVKQIVLNLLSNALKFTPAGQVAIRVDYGPEHLSIAVSDTGIGISEENQRNIFEAFAQSDSSYARRAGGTGLGLSICRRLASSLGGDITLVSRLGQGSTFTLVLPRQPVRSDN
ncbi:MAG TPA: ATP-binding protein [Thermoanaerobaculia bacterium]|nr:ATP-binding protein [Thermoanaerobaculia bacterium]